MAPSQNFANPEMQFAVNCPCVQVRKQWLEDPLIRKGMPSYREG